jgi:hypothetical protein
MEYIYEYFLEIVGCKFARNGLTNWKTFLTNILKNIFGIFLLVNPIKLWKSLYPNGCFHLRQQQLFLLPTATVNQSWEEWWTLHLPSLALYLKPSPHKLARQEFTTWPLHLLSLSFTSMWVQCTITQALSPLNYTTYPPSKPQNGKGQLSIKQWLAQCPSIHN